MKAIIMAGGEGTRLRPISSGRPKPMVELLDRPVLEHILLLLKANNIFDVCVTLGYMPKSIINYFGTGEKLGMKLSYRVEDSPLGTAGGVKNCQDFYGSDDFLVISGDAACDFDLEALIAYHRDSAPCVTMALYPHPEPLKYGLVLTDRRGEVRSFIEKPNWEKVITDLVNTGIYIISRKAMDYVPEGEKFDFSRDLFPLLMQRGETIMGMQMDGYWCDIGSADSYLQCSMDALEGKLRVTPRAEPVSPGVWCGCELPKDTKIVPPCLIGGGVTIGGDSVIGPGVVIGDGCNIGHQVSISSSVVDGADIAGGARISGAVICRGSVVREGAEIPPGSVIAPENAEKNPQSGPENGESTPRAPLGHTREIPCRSRARLMRVLAESLMEAGADFADGISITSERGVVRISPAPDRSAVIVEAKGIKGLSASKLAEEYAKFIGIVSTNY